MTAQQHLTWSAPTRLRFQAARLVTTCCRFATGSFHDTPDCQLQTGSTLFRMARLVAPRVHRRVGERKSGDKSPHSKVAAFSLLEIMVAVTLLTLITVGLLAMFNQAQRALRIANNQADIFEGTRGVLQIVARDMTELTASGQSNVANFYAQNYNTSQLPRPDGKLEPAVLSDVYWLTRVNDRWTGIGYFVEPYGNSLNVGTLHRWSTNNVFTEPTNFPALFANDTSKLMNLHRVADGVVHFQLTAYDANGTLYTINLTNDIGILPGVPNTTPIFVGFTNQFLPAYVDLEVGVLEPATLRQYQAFTNIPAVAERFLTNNVGKIHYFRERVAIRNHTQPPAL